jgi:hypothetical protein
MTYDQATDPKIRAYVLRRVREGRTELLTALCTRSDFWQMVADGWTTSAPEDRMLHDEDQT